MVAFLSFIAFVTVRWPGEYGRVVVAIFLFSIVAFIASTSAAVLTAARGTYVSYRTATPNDDEVTGDGPRTGAE